MSDTPAQVVTRFAPSPTGMLHVGGARTALFAWAYARGRGGSFLLRLEDTDQKRSSAASADAILEDLEWLGLDWDNADDVPRQSDRKAEGVYDRAVDKLLADGRAYEDGGAVRFRMDGDVAFDDLVFGRNETKADDLEDFVIRKAASGGGFPTFHLAVVVDDAWQGVTHVIRGAEHLSNTPKHAALCDALGLPRPQWAHIPSIQNPDGSKMSKRDKAKAARAAAKTADEQALADLPGLEPFMAKDSDDLDTALAIADRLGVKLPEIDVADFRHSGYLPDVLANYLALLGWNPGGDVERFGFDFISEKFDFDRVQKGPAKFDREKLLAFNADTLQQMPPEDFAATLRTHLQRRHPALLERVAPRFDVFAAQYQPRTQILDDPARLGRFFVEPPAEYDAKGVKKWLLKGEAVGLQALQAVRPVLDGVDVGAWHAAMLHVTLEAFVAEQGMPHLGGIAQPLRMALTGTPVSPEIGPTLELLGKDDTLTRIDACLAHFAASPRDPAA